MQNVNIPKAVLVSLLGLDYEIQDNCPEKAKQSFLLMNKKVIIRTYSAGVFFGTLIEKEDDEVILKDARRLWIWKTNNRGISLSEVANTGLAETSRVCATVPLHWLKAIEIIPCSDEAIKSIEEKNDYKA
jgi:hypothetical protein